MGLGYQDGHLPIGPMGTDSPRVGTWAAFTLQPLLPATGSGETGLSHPDQHRMAASWGALHRSRGHTTPTADGGVGPVTKTTPKLRDPSRGKLGTRWDTAGTKTKDSSI